MQGETDSIQATVTRTGGFTGPVTIATTGAPAGLQVAVGSGTQAGGTTTAWIQVTATASVAVASYPVTVTASGAGVATVTANLNLVIAAPPVLTQSGLFVGREHACAAGTNQLHCWGINYAGSVGDGTNQPRNRPVPVAAPVQLVGGADRCGLSRTGELWCWGEPLTAILPPVRNQTGFRFGAIAPVVVERAGALFLGWCGIVSAAVYCWDNGQPTPAAVTTGLNVTQLAKTVGVSGVRHFCALTDTGAAYCWGFNESGQLGNGSSTNQTVPTAVSGGLTFQSIAVGVAHTCAVTRVGLTHCWGNNDRGQLGVGGGNRSIATPVLTQPATTVAAGGGHSCVLTTSRQVQCWGEGRFRALGDGSTSIRTMPGPVVGLVGPATDIAAGTNTMCAVVPLGVSCWGYDESGQLGVGRTLHSPVPVAVAASTVPGFTTVAAGWHACALTSTGGNAHCWGWNQDGQLGRGPLSDVDEANDSPALTIGGGTWLQVSAGGRHTCAVGAGGAVYCWGGNRAGQLGNGLLAGSSTPVPVGGGGVYVSVAASTGGHTCGLLQNGTIRCWGNNDFGQLGIGNNVAQRLPVQVAGSAPYTRVVVGFSRTCALTVGGEAHCWGFLGVQGSHVNTPTVVLGSHVFASIATGSDHFCGITTSRETWCFGQNFHGGLGIGSDRNSKWTPVRVQGSQQLDSIAAGNQRSCGIDGNGRAWCWGMNSRGGIGDGTTAERSVPTLVSGADRFRQISVGDIVCAVTTTDALRCWGNNDKGELGLGEGLFRNPTFVPIP